MNENEQLNDVVSTENQNSEESFSLESGGFVADFRALAAGEDEYQMLRVTTELYISRLIQTYNAEIADIREVEKQKYASLDAELYQTRTELHDVRGKLEIAKDLITDVEIERDNAINEAESLKKQVEELKAQGTIPTGPTNLDGASEIAEINARIEAKKIPVYDIKDEFRSGVGTVTTFKLAENGEAGEIIWTSFKSKYRVVTEDEAARFRAELEANKADVPEDTEIPSDELAVTIEVPIFREVQDAQPTNGLDEYSAERQDVPDDRSGTVETFEQEIRRRLGDLEQKTFGHYRGEAA